MDRVSENPVISSVDGYDLPTVIGKFGQLTAVFRNLFRAIAHRVNGCLTTDGAETMTGPLLLAQTATASLPAAATANKGAIEYDTTLSRPTFSDGTAWHPMYSSHLLCGATSGTVAAGSTVYLGANAQQATEFNTSWLTGFAGKATRVVIVADAAPGVGKNFTYTLRLSFADTAMTGTISGAASTAVVLTGGPITVAQSNAIDVKLVTDAGAAAARHLYSIEIDS